MDERWGASLFCKGEAPDGRQFISENQRFTAGMLRPYEDICKNEMHPRDVTIARLVVGKRHCRVLNVGNINYDVTGFDISPISYIQPSAVPAWLTMYRHPPQLPQNKQEVPA